ncbi:hypothetical protein MKW98_020799 [Papaver atlanticum]|uniref:Solute carrier family 40 member n=1 Tax=Papaver atlanticum TaxID=357466 RepID=A0AAD4THX7_9MAGN|nr:hypothetical protein MKW98_020799 [Papaver atlanticum]
MEETRESLLGHDNSMHQFSHQNPFSLILRLYAGHFLAKWGARMWEFSVGLYMIHVWPDSLLLAAVYGVVENASKALFGPIIGKWVDRMTYVQVLQLWLLTQSLSFIVAGITVTWLLDNSGLRVSGFAVFVSLVVLTNVSGAVGILSTLAGTILIEREWVVVISRGEPPEVLTNMNSVIRRIDLSCKLFAPVASGFIISFVSLEASAVTFSLWNVISVWLQYWLLKSVYDGIPALSENEARRQERFEQIFPVEESSSISTVTEILLSHEGSSSASEAEHSWIHSAIERLSKVAFFDAWIVYLRQDVLLPGIALSLLYFTVLGFGTLMTATLEWKGIPAYVIGIMRGFNAAVGIAAIFLYPLLHSRISTLRTGLWSIWMQWSFLLLCAASVGIQNSNTSAWMLMWGVVASRLGLWMFDLSVMQQVQDQVPDSDRCIIGGVQKSLESILSLLSYAMGIIISNPKNLLESYFLVREVEHFFHVKIRGVSRHGNYGR